jgi:hypothetical protein
VYVAGGSRIKLVRGMGGGGPKAGGAGGAAVALEVGAGKSAEAITRIKTTTKEKRGIHFHFESMSEGTSPRSWLILKSWPSKFSCSG